MEAKNSGWISLFEFFHFFEAYNNYLQIDIAAENDDDLKKWKGWIESRLRLLTLKVISFFFFIFPLGSFLVEIFHSYFVNMFLD